MAAAFIGTAISSFFSWKDSGEPFDAYKYASAFFRSMWGIVPLAIGISAMGMTVEGILSAVAVGAGIDVAILKGGRLIKKKPVDVRSLDLPIANSSSQETP